MTAIKEWPVLFNGPMVRAILAGTKTQTRRVVTPANSTVNGHPPRPCWPNLLFDHAEPRGKSGLMVAIVGPDDAPPDPHLSVPYRHPEDPPAPVRDLGWYRVRPKWEAGDRLWVRETWCNRSDNGYVRDDEFWYEADGIDVVKLDGDGFAEYRKDGSPASPWRPSIHMPRRASRITLEITGVRVERVTEISEADARAEGVEADDVSKVGVPAYSARQNFARLWDAINGNRAGCSWADSPWVWVIEFRRVEG